jgi:hypothetical protein
MRIKVITQKNDIESYERSINSFLEALGNRLIEIRTFVNYTSTVYRECMIIYMGESDVTQKDI